MRHSHARSVAARAAGAALVVAALASCSSGPTAAGSVAADSAAVTAAPDCRAPQVLAALGMLTGQDIATPGASVAAHPDAPPEGPVPSGFTAQAVVVCARGGALRDAQGTWSSVAETRREGDLAPLLAALRRASTDSTGDCRPGPRAVQLWLVDVLGQAVRVAAPGSCGVPIAAVASALDALDVTSTETYPVRLVVPAPSAGS